MAFLWLEVPVAEIDLGFAAIDGIVVIVQLIQSWCTETCGVGGSYIEHAGRVHQRHLWGEVVSEGLVMCIACPDGGCQVVQELVFVLTVEGKGVGSLVDVARSGFEFVASPIGSKDGGRVLCQSEHGLQVCFVGMLLFRQHEVAHLVGRGLHIVFFAVSETVCCEGGLQGVLLREFVDAACVPAEPLVLHFIVGASCDVGACVGTIG